MHVQETKYSPHTMIPHSFRSYLTLYAPCGSFPDNHCNDYLIAQFRRIVPHQTFQPKSHTFSTCQPWVWPQPTPQLSHAIACASYHNPRLVSLIGHSISLVAKNYNHARGGVTFDQQISTPYGWVSVREEWVQTLTSIKSNRKQPSRIGWKDGW